MSTFEESMGSAVRAQAAGDHSAALLLRVDAVHQATDPLQKGRALRDLSASYSKTGDFPNAFRMSSMSLSCLNDGPPRELAASEVQYAQVVATEALSDLPFSPGIATHFHNANQTLRSVEDSYFVLPRFRIDQYRINMAARRSVAEALTGNRRDATVLAGRAACLAVRSESSKLPTSNPELTNAQRYKIKARQMAGAAVAFTVAGLFTEKPGWRKKTATKLAKSILA